MHILPTVSVGRQAGIDLCGSQSVVSLIELTVNCRPYAKATKCHSDFSYTQLELQKKQTERKKREKQAVKVDLSETRSACSKGVIGGTTGGGLL